jgi:hypothetical protein
MPPLLKWSIRTFHESPIAVGLWLVLSLVARAGEPAGEGAEQKVQPSSEMIITPKHRAFWSFQPIRQAIAPRVNDSSWAKTPIDEFILAKIESNGLSPSPRASRLELIRRVHFDLIGLPPSPTEIEAFVQDNSPNAYERLVDRLLNSPHYGERWGQHWLDVVRYAETEGFEYDRNLPDAWRYRDYVIKSFNEDKPYNRFVIEQLAGDEIANNISIGRNDAAHAGLEKNQQLLAPIAAAEPSGGSAQPQIDSAAAEARELQIAAGFHRLGPVRRNAGNQDVTSSRNEVLTERTDIIGAAFIGLTVGCARCHDHKFDPIPQKDYYRIQAFLAATAEHELALASNEEKAAWKARTGEINEEIKKLKEKAKGLKGEEAKRLRQIIEDAEGQLPTLPTVATVKNEATNRTPIHVLKRGDWNSKGDGVGMRGLGVLLPEGTPELPPDTDSPRSALARWIADSRHPLTARVMVNRIWLYHFGQGLAKTANDFGKNGDPPSHPELLDYLARQFLENGWRMKPLHRLICLSSTYQQSSRSPHVKAATDKDPENRLLWRFRPRRLEAEEIRDAMLAVSGLLNPKAGGPSVIVPVDQELINFLYKPSQWAVTTDQNEHHRRSIYLMAKRNLRLPFMEAFDQPASLTSCARRESSTHAPQALELLNGQTANTLATAFAERLGREAGSSPAGQIDRAYWLAVGRAPSEKERKLAVEFVKTQSLREFALAVFNLNAFLYVE